MLQALKARANVRALQWLGRDRVDYLASNTMTVLNRAVNDFLWTFELKAVVTAVRDEAPGVKTFILMPNQHWQGMQAGQYVEVTVDIDGQSLTRCYSPCRFGQARIPSTSIPSQHPSPCHHHDPCKLHPVWWAQHPDYTRQWLPCLSTNPAALRR